MVSNVIKYSGVYAKTCALKSKLLKYKDFVKLAGATDVNELAEMLGAIESYKESVEEAIEYGGSRIAIERSLIKALYRDYAALYSFVNSPSELKYFDAIFLKYAVGIIKRLIRRLFDHRDIHNVVPQYGNFMTRHLGLNIERIEDSKNIDELLENVRGTDLYGVLSKIDKEKATLFDYETQLDFFCFLRMYQYQEKYLSKQDRQTARHINGTEIDLQNIMWIYRAKTYYDITNETVFTYLIPLHYKLTAEKVKELVQAEDRQAFLDALGSSHYKDVFKDLDADSLEKDFNSYMHKQYLRERKRNPYSVSSTVFHLYFKGREIRNLTTLIECIRYKLSPEATLKKLSLDHLEDFQSENMSV